MKNHTTALRWSLLLLFLLSGLFAILYLDLKRQALGYHQRDYPFYIQFAAKLFDPELSRRFSLNPDGFNYLRFAGTEGERSFQQSIHLEPIRYLYAAVYSAAGSHLGVFAFYAFFYFLPVAYIAWAAPLRRRLESAFYLLFVLLYVFHPLTLALLADDLRPRTLMISALILAFLSIHWRRRWAEKLALFGLLLATREEALIPAAGLILYDLLQAYSVQRKQVTTVLFACAWLAWALIQQQYFAWTGYEVSRDLNLVVRISGFLWNWAGVGLAASLAAVTALIVRAYLRGAVSRSQALGFGATILFVALPAVLSAVNEEAHLFTEQPLLPALGNLLNDLFFFPKNGILFAAGLLLLAQGWEAMTSERSRRIILRVASIVLLSVALVGGGSALRSMRAYQAALPGAQVLFELRAVADRRSAVILTDYAANQVFYDYENLYVYQRLPAYLIPHIPHLRIAKFGNIE